MVEHVRYVEAGKVVPDNLKEKINTAANELFDKYSLLSGAEGKLILLGHDQVQELSRDYGETIKDFRRTAWPGNAQLTELHLDDYRQTILMKRNNLYKELRRVYK